MKARLRPFLAPAGIVMTALALFGPFWVVGVEGQGLGMPIRGVASFGMFGITTAIESQPFPTTTAISYEGHDSIGRVVGAAAILIAVGGLLEAVSLAVPRLARQWKYRAVLSLSVSVLGPALVLLGDFVVMIGLPGAAAADTSSTSALVGSQLSVGGFVGSDTVSLPGLSMNVSWGPGWGWMLALLGTAGFVIPWAAPAGKAGKASARLRVGKRDDVNRSKRVVRPGERGRARSGSKRKS